MARRRNVWGGSTYVLWMNQFTCQAGAEWITHVALPWSHLARDGLPVQVLIYRDPNNDGHPNDAVLLTTAEAENFYSGYGEPLFAVVPVEPTYVGPPGSSFFVGAFRITESDFVPVSEYNQSELNRSWSLVSATPIDPANISAAGNLSQFSHNWFIRAKAIDCNGNSVWDDCDITGGVSLDRNKNGVPDECESPLACFGDINMDQTVNVVDLLLVINSWGPCPAPPASCAADIAPPGPPMGDGVVNVADLLTVINAWGPCR